MWDGLSFRAARVARIARAIQSVRSVWVDVEFPMLAGIWSFIGDAVRCDVRPNGCVRETVVRLQRIHSLPDFVMREALSRWLFPLQGRGRHPDQVGRC